MTSANNPFWEQGLEGFFQKQGFPTIPMQTGIFYYYIDDLDRAEAFLLEALKQSEGRYFEVYNNLGAVYYKKKMMPEASLCYRIVLEENPENEIARRRVQSFR
jgi:tetratricopeptide (TPR) repeat protein